ncbi:MAG: RNA methyltransferase [Cyanobacterium sp. T60_A2020_053]|nr:RNA methyltransferase [Cyanobacterium sp. T60_A2020_053]
MDQIKIILVEPAGERNIGSIARVMKNMGCYHLTIVNPRCHHNSEDARIMAVHGVEILDNAEIVPTLPEALKDCQKAIATTARPRGIPTHLEKPQDCLPWLLSGRGALVFGPEDRGLSNQELSHAQRFVCIPSNPEYPSLNLAQAVGICLYELSKSASDNTITDNDLDLATLKDLEGYYQHLESLLLRVNYLYPHTAPVQMSKFRRIFNRNQLQTQEVAMLRGILRQIEWHLSNEDNG